MEDEKNLSCVLTENSPRKEHITTDGLTGTACTCLNTRVKGTVIGFKENDKNEEIKYYSLYLDSPVWWLYWISTSVGTYSN